MDIIEKYSRDGRALIEIASARESAPAARLLDMSRDYQSKIIADVLKNPVKSDVIKLDIRFRLGMASALGWIIAQPEKAAKYIEIIDKEGG